MSLIKYFLVLNLLFYLFFGCVPSPDPPKPFRIIDITNIKVIEDTIYPYQSCPIVSGTIATIEFTMTNNIETPIYTWVYDTNFFFIAFIDGITTIDDLKKEQSLNPLGYCGHVRCQVFRDSLLLGIPKTYRIELNEVGKSARLDHSKKYIVYPCVIYMRTDSIINDTLFNGFTMNDHDKKHFEFSPLFELDFPKNTMRLVSKQYYDSLTSAYTINYNSIPYIFK